MGDDQPIARLNAEIPGELKTEFAIYCLKENISIKEATALAIKLFLEEMGGKK